MGTEHGPGALAGATGAGGYRVLRDTQPITTFAHPLQTAVDAALDYARRGWPGFPCYWEGERRKRPLIERGLNAASQDETQIRNWWRRWPHALIGIPTGRASGFVVLDVDVKSDVYGPDALADLGFAILPDTPIVHTASGGLHLYFRVPDHGEIRNTAGERGSGIGRGLDWRGTGGYAVIPSPGSGYRWDPHWNLETSALHPVPAALLPREPPRLPTAGRPVRPATGLSPYAEAALDGACRRILAAPDGEQEQTLNNETFAIGTLAGAGAIPAHFARRTLIWAARQIPDYDHRQPWRAAEIEAKIDRAFDEGMRRPRKLRRA